MLPNPKPYFDQVPDPRRETENKRHALSDILSIALCAVLSGIDDWESVEEFARSKESWLRQFLPLTNGIPSHDTFGRVFSLIDPAAFESAFFDWASAARIGGATDTHLALDGKTVRRSHRGSAGRALHLVHAWSCQTGLLLAQSKVDEKANEIVAIPEVLSLFDLHGVTVTIDAMGCQKTIASQIIESGGDMESLADSSPEGQAVTIEKDHGRIETRRVWASENTAWLDQKPDWAGLRTLVMVEAVREIGGKTSTERRCYIASLPADAENIGRIVRAHWGIENSLHWVLDVAFNEDQSRVRAGQAAENLAIIRRFALNLLRLNKRSKLGVKNKRLRAAYDDDFRAEVLNFK